MERGARRGEMHLADVQTAAPALAARRVGPVVPRGRQSSTPEQEAADTAGFITHFKAFAAMLSKQPLLVRAPLGHLGD